jgi:hypothetical protein
VQAVYAQGGFEKVDAAYEDLPISTEQIIHPDKYLTGEPRLSPELPEIKLPPEKGWDVVYENTFGEFLLRTWLESLGATGTPAANAAAGWAGDTYALLEDDSGNTAMVARVDWDTPQSDATEFVNTLTEALSASGSFSGAGNAWDVASYWQGPAAALGFIASDGDTVWLAAGPDVDFVRKLVASVTTG